VTSPNSITVTALSSNAFSLSYYKGSNTTTDANNTLTLFS